MAVFADYLDLRTAVIEQVGRSSISDVFPRLTLMAEDALNRKLRLRDQMTSTTLTLTSGTVPLPVDFLEVIGVYTPAGIEYVQQPAQSAKNNGCFFTIDGSNLKIHGYSGDVELEYYAALPTITGSMTGTNWLLSKFPQTYLYAVAFEAAKFMRDRDLASDMAGLLGVVLDDAKIDDERARYSRSRVRVQGYTP